MKTITSQVAGILALFAGCAQAHVSLEQPGAEAGQPYRAILRVGHGCEGAATTRLALQIPPGFANARPLARPGWIAVLKGTQVSWNAGNAAAALPNGERGEFVLEGIAPRLPGVLWLKVQQTCGQATQDWSQVPASGTSTAGLKFPAVALMVLSAQDYATPTPPVQVKGAWLRPAVQGQQATGGYMLLTARETLRLVGVATPVAAVAEVHEMKMEGDVMKMRPLASLELPAGQTVELKPGGYHLMLQELRQPLPRGSVVPLTLVLRNAAGVESRVELKVPVEVAMPGAAGVDGHKHKH